VRPRTSRPSSRESSNKLAEEQEEVEWTRRAVRTNRRYRLLATFNLVVAGVLAAGLVALAVSRLLP